MIAATAREIRDGELVFVGMRLPLIAYAVAKRLHAPRALGLFESGIVRDDVPTELLYTMGDPANIEGAAWCTSLVNVMGLLARGEVHLGLVGAAEIDRHGNVNTSYIGAPERPQVKLPGSGGGADIASLAGRTVILLAQERHRFVEQVSYATSPGHGTGGSWRHEVGLRGGGPTRVITTLAVFGFEDGEMVLESVHPGSSLDEVRGAVGWELRVSPGLAVTPAPTADELRAMREYDPAGIWRR
jgi:glutaconate CoA-transferase, subunit B